jgi:GH18 family chitinase
VGNCDRKSECDPNDYGDYAESSKCLLNVCCSKFGFCGTTEEFCGKKKVKRPSCSKDGSLNRVVGYYEGWSPSRPCHAFYPEQIPLGIYTHLNYAFASIDPKSFEIVVATESEKKLMTRLTDLKKIDPNLKVFIAVGSWTFNDLGATQTVFSDLAASESKQKKFFSSLQSFMSIYDFDGIDLD